MAANEDSPFLHVRDTRVPTDSTAVASSDVGTLLCATRMRLGRDLQKVAEVLHIRYNYLVAIEDGRYEDLPGQAYAIGFVRAYADYLGLDGNEVVRRFKEESAGIRRKATFEFPIPTPDSGLPSGASLLIAIVSGMMIYGAWYSIAGADRGAVELIQEVPSRLTALLDENAVDTESRSTPPEMTSLGNALEPNAELASDEGEGGGNLSPIDSEDDVPNVDIAEDTGADAGLEEEGVSEANVSAPAVEAQVAAVPREPVRADSSSQNIPESSESGALEAETTSTRNESGEAAPEEAGGTAESASETADQVDAVEPDSPTTQQINDDVTETSDAVAGPSDQSEQNATEEGREIGDVVELRAKTDSWIQLRDGEELLLTRLLRKGEVFRVPEQGGLTLMTGNAGGLEVLVNGEVMPPIGVEGTVARDVLLDPKSLQNGAE